MARTIDSPGVEIREFDLSLNATLPVGTNVFVQGFAAAGPTDELLNITSMSELEQVYGVPTNAAERYFYHTAKQVINSPGNLLCTRLPYGSGDGTGYGDYTAMLYPASGFTGGWVLSGTADQNLTDLGSGYNIFGVEVSSISTTTFDAAEAVVFGAPVQITLNSEEYFEVRSESFAWTGTSTNFSSMTSPSTSDCGKAGIIVINDNKYSTNQDYEGYYITVADQVEVGGTDFDKVEAVAYSNSSNVWTGVPTTLLNFSLTGSAQNNPNSISEDIEAIPGFSEFENAAWRDSLIVGLHRIRKTAYTSQPGLALDKVISEGYYGSLNENRKESPFGVEQSAFLENVVNQSSGSLYTMVNPYISRPATGWTDANGLPKRAVRVLNSAKKAYALGDLRLETNSTVTKVIGNVPQKLERSLRLAENKEQIPIDIVVDGGISTIWTGVQANSTIDFDDSLNVSMTELENQSTGTSSPVQNNWETIWNLFEQFVGQFRKDCLLIVDPLRYIFVEGKDSKTLDNPNKNFSQHVYWPLKNLFAATNSNYACTYGNWVKVWDNNLADYVWLPFSGFQANIFANLDSNLQPWFAGAGLNNGIIRGVVDIGCNPTQKHRDLLYRININPIVFFPGDGYVVWGQKTLQKKPSAFDRINVRRLFLTLEKATLAVMRYFVFEPNTVFTRTRVVNVLTPLFEIAKNNEGVYDYLIVCDERNNTAQVIDNNELVVDIYLKPVRIAEFILVNFYATRTDQDFTELL